MYTEKDLLLQSAARLYTLGVDVEGAGRNWAVSRWRKRCPITRLKCSLP